MLLYPAIDMLDGQAVRLRQGKRDDVTVFGDPVELAKKWRATGAEWLHLVDLTAAFEGKTAHLPLIREVVAAFDGRVELGGGLRTMEDTIINSSTLCALDRTRTACPAKRWRCLGLYSA